MRWKGHVKVYGKYGEYIQDFVGKAEGRDHLGGLDVGGRILLDYILTDM
jgi:hypothetical protein